MKWLLPEPKLPWRNADFEVRVAGGKPTRKARRGMERAGPRMKGWPRYSAREIRGPLA